jgi:hypothetical protein
LDATAIVGHLVNAGGLGILAAVLFYLHTTSLRAFREELERERSLFISSIREERDYCTERSRTDRDASNRRGEAVVASLTNLSEEIKRQQHTLADFLRSTTLHDTVEQEMKRQQSREGGTER